MIGKLTGKPSIVGELLLIDVNGVGYSVITNNHTRLEAATADLISLYIHTHVREDRIELYGFLEFQEKELFELLIDVSGVGPKTAIGITERGSRALVEAIQQADIKFFTSVPR